MARHVLLDGGLGDAVAEEREFVTDPRSSPQAILARQAADQLAHFDRDGRAARLPARAPAPDETPACTVPADDGRRLDEAQGVPPASPPAPEDHPEEAVASADARSMDAAPEHGDLLTESDVLEGQLGLRDQEGAQQNDEHRLLIGRGLQRAEFRRPSSAP